MEITAHVVHVHPADSPAALTSAALQAALSAVGTVVEVSAVQCPDVSDDATHAPAPRFAGERLAITGAEVPALRAAVDAALADSGVPTPQDDGGAGRSGETVAVVPAALTRADTKLLIMDVDSTLIQQEVIELLAAHAGREAEVAEVTEAAMRGELDFAESLHARVKALAGLDAAVIDEVRQRVAFSPGARELVRAFKAAGHIVAVVSGGFQQILAPWAEELHLDHALANELEVIEGRLTGRVVGDVVDREAKERHLRAWAAEHGLELSATIAAGDGANDLDMVSAAGLGVAYCAKPALAVAADARIDLPRLDLLGVYAGVDVASSTIR
ncbi:phosphoserine phosphatase SerB [Zhihengliuella flava]|uniref:phosphoserine phosphatase n=1 Tax=Zhihengliuella flava TaxID=1285193 RepID=A0A931GGG3_9MICC|nr:phosphoserine phosphatase SerB [Zhihengliuella flava]MBG6085772.1 phosphoserine phosphatase [Zhihengliuella flava]